MQSPGRHGVRLVQQLQPHPGAAQHGRVEEALQHVPLASVPACASVPAAVRRTVTGGLRSVGSGVAVNDTMSVWSPAAGKSGAVVSVEEPDRAEEALAGGELGRAGQGVDRPRPGAPRGVPGRSGDVDDQVALDQVEPAADRDRLIPGLHRHHADEALVERQLRGGGDGEPEAGHGSVGHSAGLRLGEVLGDPLRCGEVVGGRGPRLGLGLPRRRRVRVLATTGASFSVGLATVTASSTARVADRPWMARSRKRCASRGARGVCARRGSP